MPLEVESRPPSRTSSYTVRLQNPTGAMIHLRRHWCERPKLCARNVGNSTIVIHSRQQYSKPKDSLKPCTTHAIYILTLYNNETTEPVHRTTTMHYSKQKGRVPYHTRKTTKSVSLLQRLVYSIKCPGSPTIG